MLFLLIKESWKKCITVSTKMLSITTVWYIGNIGINKKILDFLMF